MGQTRQQVTILFRESFHKELPHKATFLVQQKRAFRLGCVKDSHQSGHSVSRSNTWDHYGQHQKAASQINMKRSREPWNTANNNTLPQPLPLFLQYSVLSITRGNGGEGVARIIEENG